MPLRLLVVPKTAKCEPFYTKTTFLFDKSTKCEVILPIVFSNGCAVARLCSIVCLSPTRMKFAFLMRKGIAEVTMGKTV